MNPLLDKLRQGRVLVSDGAWGTFLMEKGMSLGDCPELWCVEQPAAVRGIAQMYVDAGADIVMTNSFGGTRLKLAGYGLEDRTAELNEAAARLSREAAGDAVHVLASMGPTGKMLMTGEVTEEAIYDAFKEQAQALERGGADGCSIETMMDLDEACLGVRAVKENTGLAVFASFTFGTKTAEGYRTMMGVSPEDAAQAVCAAGAAGLGTNCSLGSAAMIEVVAALHAAAPGVPILAHPNAGQPIHQDDGSVTYPETPADMAAKAPAFVAAGAGIIGGCCGTGPDHIRAIRRAVDAAG